MKHEARFTGPAQDRDLLIAQSFERIAFASAGDLIKREECMGDDLCITVRLYTIAPANVNRIIEMVQNQMELYYLIFGPEVPIDTSGN